jgi:hypothetical protein
MEFIPKALIIGVFAAVAPGAASSDAINRIWMQLSRRMGYRQLVQGGEGGAQFLTNPDDAFIIQPPLLQFRSPVNMTWEHAAEDAEVCLKTAGEHLGANQFANLGIKQVLHATVPDNDARAFIQTRLLRGGDEGLQSLVGAGEGWVGLKYGLQVSEELTRTLVIEPLVADPKMLFIDLDSQHGGPADLDHIADRANDAERFLAQTVRPYLDDAENIT